MIVPYSNYIPDFGGIKIYEVEYGFLDIIEGNSISYLLFTFMNSSAVPIDLPLELKTYKLITDFPTSSALTLTPIRELLLIISTILG